MLRHTLVLLLLLAACAPQPRNPVPESLAPAAVIPGIPTARFWGDAATPELHAWVAAGFQRERAYLDSQNIPDWPDAAFLALSGGGSDGAFGAGLLCGWTAHGSRPTFRVVTGVSTGALIAPFAFVGPDYDHVLKELYTSISTRDIGSSRGLIDGLLSDSLMDSAGLRAIVEKHVDQPFLDRVADEYRKGRGLIICTTNMDSQRPVIWAMGAIAASKHPDSLQLFRDVMMASAAIPGVFPPVIIPVQADGKSFDEMHADGGVSSQVFLYPASFSIKQISDDLGIKRKRTVYVIRNAQLTPDFQETRRRTLPIAQRAVATLIKTQGVGDLYRIYLGSVRDGLNYHLAYIPDDFKTKSKEDFDPIYMRALFQSAHDQAAKGYPWHKAPPGFEPPPITNPKP